MDWILLSYVISAWFIPIMVLSIPITIIGFIAFCVCMVEDEIEEWKEAIKKLKSVIFVLCGLCFICGGIIVVASLPDILIEANIARIKLRYTDMEAVEKVESGALKVVEKLDKLIDKGIKQIEE